MRLAAVAEGKRAVEGVEAARLALEEKVRQTADGSGETLRAATAAMVEEVSRAVADATERFAGTGEEIRKAALDLQRELATTRAELEKGLLEMPAEAREASGAMRRAITEQIEAINELTRIVARSAGEAMSPAAPRLATPTLPVASEPVIKPTPKAAEERETPTQTPPVSAPVADRGAVSQPAHPAEPFGRPANASATSKAANTGAAAKPSRGTAERQSERRPRAGNGEARGWVADLLRRASSHEEEEASPEAAAAPEPTATTKRPSSKVVESLNSLSIDIAKAIDHDASLELWDRYKKGERNVFTRRLYTLQGQKTFDELRRKYERDGDFRKAVDNYIGDFERLLAQISKDEPDPAVAKKYLTSDTGKVYTMLAHAAGRLT
jgi:hypothetical protein